jgi:hypothetical protein
MVRFRKTGLLAAILAGIVCMGLPPPADAAFRLRISDGTTTVNVTDSDGDGFVSYSGAIGNFVINFTAGTSKPALPNTQYLANMDITSFDVTSSNGGGTLTVDLTDTGFALAPLPAYYLTSSATGNTNGSVTFQSIVDMRNSGTDEFTSSGEVNGTTVVSTGLQGPLSGAFGGGSPGDSLRTLAFSGTSPFSLTSRTVITLGSNGYSSFDGLTTVAVPAPGGAALLLAGLPFLGVYQWRRRRKLAVVS